MSSKKTASKKAPVTAKKKPAAKAKAKAKALLYESLGAGA